MSLRCRPRSDRRRKKERRHSRITDSRRRRWTKMRPSSANVFLPFSFFGQSVDGSEVTSSFSITNSATFTLGYSALFPATPSGAYDSATIANTALVFIFMLPFRHSISPNGFFQTLPMPLFVLPNPPVRLSYWTIDRLLSQEFRNTPIPVH